MKWSSRRGKTNFNSERGKTNFWTSLTPFHEKWPVSKKMTRKNGLQRASVFWNQNSCGFMMSSCRPQVSSSWLRKNTHKSRILPLDFLYFCIKICIPEFGFKWKLTSKSLRLLRTYVIQILWIDFWDLFFFQIICAWWWDCLKLLCLQFGK